MKHALSMPQETAADVALHEARKAAKRARYAGEAVTAAFGAEGSGLRDADEEAAVACWAGIRMQ